MTASDRPVTDPSSDLDDLFRGHAPVEPPKAVSDAICRHCTKSLHSGRGASAHQRVMLSLLISGTVTGLLVAVSVAKGSAGATLSSALYGAAGWAIIQALVLVFALARPPGRKPARAVRLDVYEVE